MVFIDEFEREGVERAAVLQFPSARTEPPAKRRKHAPPSGLDIQLALCKRVVVAVAAQSAPPPPAAEALPDVVYTATMHVDDFLRLPGMAAALRRGGAVVECGGVGVIWDGVLRLALPEEAYAAFGVPHARPKHSATCGVENVRLDIDDVLGKVGGAAKEAPTHAAAALHSLGPMRITVAAAGGVPLPTTRLHPERVGHVSKEVVAPFALPASSPAQGAAKEALLREVAEWVGLAAVSAPDAPSPSMDAFAGLPRGRTRLTVHCYTGLFAAPAVARHLAAAARAPSVRWVSAECTSLGSAAPPWTSCGMGFAPTLALGASQRVLLRGGEGGEVHTHLLRATGDLA